MAATADAGDGRQVAVVGAGYVGLTTAVCLAHLGHRVTCADTDTDKIARLRRGEPTILEEGIGALLAEGLHSGRLAFVENAAAAVGSAELTFLCLPTPGNLDGTVDVSAVEAVAREIAAELRPGSIIVSKSTMPVGSTKLMEQLIDRPDVAVVSNPEFLREGSAVHDALHPARVVVGSHDEAAALRVAELFQRTGAPIILTDPASAEAIKYASNAFLATKLSFVNALARTCELVGADIGDVLAGMGHDPRIGLDHLSPGPGWGGSCLPKDVRALLAAATDAGYDFPLLAEVLQSNEDQMKWVVGKVTSALGGTLEGATVAVWGLTFKARTDDRRDSPAVQVVEQLLAGGASVRAFDPTVRGPLPELARFGSRFVVQANAYAACEGAALLVLLTEWEEFRLLDAEKVAGLLAGSHVIDARNLLDPGPLRRSGLSYVGIGRG